MSCVSTFNPSQQLTCGPCRNVVEDRVGFVQEALWVVYIEEIQTDKRDREGRKGYAMRRGGGLRGVSSLLANCQPIEWNGSERQKSSLLCAGGWNIWAIESKSALFFYSMDSVWTDSPIQLPMSNHSPPFLFFCLPTFICSVSCSISTFVSVQ